MSNDEDRKDDPADELRQGLGHLWRAARGAAAGIKKEVDRSDLGKALDDAGRELVRATANVVDRISTEVGKVAKPPHRPASDVPPPPPHAGDEDEFDGVKPKPRASGSTPEDPGVRIAVADDEKPR